MPERALAHLLNGRVELGRDGIADHLVVELVLGGVILRQGLDEAHLQGSGGFKLRWANA
jgi:hypothetical protein